MAWPVFIVNTQDYQCFLFFTMQPTLGTNAGHCNDISSRCCHQQWLCGASRWSCQLVWVVVFREWIRQDPVWCIIVLTSPASLLKKANRQASINDRDNPGVRTRLFKQNLVSNLFKIRTFPVHWMGIPHLWAICSLVSRFFVENFTLWAVERQQVFVRETRMWPVCGKVGLSCTGETNQPPLCCCCASWRFHFVIFLFLITS